MATSKNGKKAVHVDEEGERIVFEHIAPSRYKNMVISEVEATVERLNKELEEKNNHIKKLELNYKLLEMRLGNMRRDLNNQQI